MPILSLDIDVYQYLLCIPIYLLYILSVLPICVSVYTAFSKSRNKPVPAAWRAIIDITLIGGFKSVTTEDGRKLYFLFGYPVTPGYVRAIGIFTISLWVSLLDAFWLNFIIKVTEGCRTGIDCFYANT